MGLFEDPISRNTWNYLGGPAGSVWTGYVIGSYHTSLYGYSPQRFDWVPAVADGLPTALAKETVDGTEFWTTEVSIKQGVEWSDGEPLTADDFVFTVSTVRELNLGSNWSSLVHPAFVDRAEALDDHRLKIYFKSTDADGNAQTPGLSIWQFGLAFMPILPEHYWAPVVEEARSAGEVPQQIEALFAHVPDGEPTANGLEYSQWEPGAFFENETVPDYYSQGTQVTEYANGAYEATNERTGYTETYYGEPTGDKVLELEIGPHFESEIFSIYGNQDSAILALTKGDIDFLFNPLGLEKGFLDRVRQTADLQVVENLDNGVFYLGFNTRKPPMDNKAFRQAVATVIDKEFVTQTILQDTAIPMYAMVPEGNAFWYNDSTSKIGLGLGRGERIAAAVELLKGAGFTYEKEPEVSADGAFVINGGEGPAHARRQRSARTGADRAQRRLRPAAVDLRHLDRTLAERPGHPHQGAADRVQPDRGEAVQRDRGQGPGHVDPGLGLHDLPQLPGEHLPQPPLAGTRGRRRELGRLREPRVRRPGLWLAVGNHHRGRA